MTEALKDWMLGLCGAAAVCALALAVCPGGRVKGVLRVVCGAVMTIALLSPAVGFDFAAYSQSLEKYRLGAETAAKAAADKQDILSRTIIEDELAAYILDKAAALGLTLSSAQVSAKWSEDGFWYPYEASLAGAGAEETKKELAEIMESELGIPRDRQHWEEEGE